MKFFLSHPLWAGGGILSTNFDHNRSVVLFTFSPQPTRGGKTKMPLF
ncbi:MAG: hypothetical protein LBR79_00360 [Oscillospiraceae bacterium]|nr:hypothetical protein [Oscillospiraceae bacterium]